jgi:FAD/FMN-containing dehydrogenase/Fe-S oxidoreductase
MRVEPAQSLQHVNLLQNHIQGEVFIDDYQRALYSTDASIYQVHPLAVVIPRTQADLVATMQFAAEQNLPIVPRGGGTSLSGQAIGAGIVVDCSKYLRQILEIDPTQQIARVQPGVVLDQLNRSAAKFQLQFGPDVSTSSRATIGGMIGNNSAGARSLWYGKTVDHVVELAAVLADGTPARLAPLSASEIHAAVKQSGLLGTGLQTLQNITSRHQSEILACFPRLLRRVSGYNLDEFVPEFQQLVPRPRAMQSVRDREAARYPNAEINLAKLLVGAEGTLGLIGEALVHLVPLPPRRGVLVLHFDSLTHAVESVTTLLDENVSAIELLDGLVLRLARQSLEYRNYLDFVVGNPETLLLVEISGESPSEINARGDVLAKKCRSLEGVTHVLSALEPDLYRHVWACRKASLPLLLGLPGERKPVAFVEDAAVPPERLTEFVRRFIDLLAQHQTEGAFYGHASVGCLHIRPMLNLKTAPDVQRLSEISRAVSDLVLEFGGAMSGEHGDGLARSYLNEKLFGKTLYEDFRRIKQAFDPTYRLNPGKIVDAPPPTDALRYGAQYATIPINTALDFSRQGGFATAAELCNGSGVCRKLDAGTMCPSYMATLDEEHSTRGRANALRLVLSGALPHDELTGHRLHETMELCLECKACKAECPSNVDVAKLKMEFLSQYQERHGATLGQRMLGHAAALNRLGSALAPLSNLLNKTSLMKWLAEKTLGIDRRRALPEFQRNHFRRWFDKQGPRVPEGNTANVVLLDDCLTSFVEPNINRAAVELLVAAGHGVALANLECCGRTLCSKGFLREAQSLAERNIAKLSPLVQNGATIVVSEPSCWSMLVDEYRDLVPGSAAEQVAAATVFVDDFIGKSCPELAFMPSERAAILHGHCHQKALCGMQGVEGALRRIPGFQLTTLDSGCCGMAGSFGYEHYDLSMQIGERVLFPAVRNAENSLCIAPGFSCREQIRQGTGRRSLHPVEVLRNSLHRI